jgi:histidine triad (HIT) family protein
MTQECLFCSIVAGDIPALRVFEDHLCLGFVDIHPQAPTHILIIPKEHIGSLAQTQATQAPLLGHLLESAASIARNAGLTGGYRIVVNTGIDGGQTVDHLHLHLLGGRPMTWPPG